MRDINRNIISKGDKQTAKEALKLARNFSSGTESLADLRAAGHPYAKASPNSAYDPSIINDQGGPFKRSWEETTVNGNPGIHNTDPKAAYLEQKPEGTNGTIEPGGAPSPASDSRSAMVQRPLLQKVVDFLEPIRKANYDAAIAANNKRK